MNIKKYIILALAVAVSSINALAANWYDNPSRVAVIDKQINLKGKTVTINGPYTLEFKGGKLINGVIVVKGGPIRVVNVKDAAIFKSVYFRNETSWGAQLRCCEGACRDSWFEAKDDDDMLNMAFAFDKLVLTRPDYSLKQSTKDYSRYPDKYRFLCKDFAIESESGHSRLATAGQISMYSFKGYAMPLDYTLSLKGIEVIDVKSDYSYDKYDTQAVHNTGFFNGSLDNEGTFTLNAVNCKFKGVYQLMQFNTYNKGMVINMENTVFDCGSFAMEIYNPGRKPLKFRARDCRFDSYKAWALSLVNIDADIRFDNCTVGGVELSLDGYAEFNNCDLYRTISQYGPDVLGTVVMNGCTLHEKADYGEATIMDFNGIRQMRINDCNLVLDEKVYERKGAAKVAESSLLSFKRCPDVNITGCSMYTSDMKELKHDYVCPTPVSTSEGSKVKFKSLKVSPSLKNAMKGKARFKTMK